MAVGDALKREGHVVDTREPRVDEYLAFLGDLQRRIAAAPTLDPRHPDEILYDEDGLPK